MSVINDALKKAGKENPPAGVFDNSASKKGFRPELLQKRHQANWGPLFVLLVLLLITGPILAPAISIPFKSASVSRPAVLQKASPAAPASAAFLQNSAAQNVKSQFGIEEVPSIPAVVPERPNLALNGIVLSQTNKSDSYCLINGKIIKVGEGVDGAKLIKVTADEVTLDYRGEKIVLPVAV